MTKVLLDTAYDSKTTEEELVKNNMGLVLGISKRFFGRGYDCEDIIQIGTIGLIKAIRKFDKSYNVCFSTYAVPLIIGEIKRFIRDDGIIKVSRTHKTNAVKARLAEEKLSTKLNRNPTVSEISAECGLKAEEIIEALDATAPVESIYQAYSDDGEKIIDRIGNFDEENKILSDISIKESLNILDSRERKIIVMRYFFQKTQSDIAKTIGISQVQVSRLEKGALLKMRLFLEH